MSRSGGRAWRRALVAAAALLLAAPSSANDAGLSRAFSLLPDDVTAEAPERVVFRGVLDLTPLVQRHTEAAELSGLAWDADDKILYAVTDRGYLLHLVPRFEGGRLTGVDLAASHRLKDGNGKRLRGTAADAEGLDGRRLRNGVSGDAELVVSFERQARIERFDTRGGRIGTERIVDDLRNADRYASANKGLEAVSVHPSAGVITAPEYPLKGMAPGTVRIYGPDGPVLDFPRLEATNAAVVALESLPDGRLLVMERAFNWWTVSLRVSLRLFDAPGTDEDGAGTPLLDMDSARGWQLDNFEGLTRHEGARFFMASDDNGRAWQTTLLAYFELLDEEL